MNCIIPKTEYNKIAAEWEPPIYQEWQTIEERFTFLALYLAVFKDKRVLELGCNASIQIYSIMQYAASYIGIEPNTHYYNQACITRKYLQNKDAIHIRNGTLNDYHSVTQNAFFGSNILYWLSDYELRILDQKILSKCDCIVVLTRAKERNSQHNSFHLNRKENVEKLLSGFSTRSYDLPLHKVNRHYAGGYFITIGER